MSLLAELKRRNVIRVATAYVIAAWIVIQVVETIFPAFGFGDTAIRLVVIILAIAFIPTLVFSWAFEITPEGLKREVDVAREDSITRFTGKKLDRIIMVLLALALGYFAFDKFVLDPVEDVQIAESAHQEGRSAALTESFGDKSIAVLPFVNISADPEQEYFSDGISEELLNLLAKIPELRVISRSSSFSFKGKDTAIPAIAQQLNVAHVLEGSVRKAGNRVRITAQLIEARSDTHLWSESYDRELDDIFAVQDEIAAAISDALKMKLALVAGESVLPTAIKTANTNAYDAYLRGRELIRLRGLRNLQDAIGHLERSLRLDETFAPAHAQLAMATILLTMNNGPSTLEETRRRAIPHLDRALELEPDLAEAHGGRAMLAWMNREYEAVIEHARKALASNPNYVDAMYWLGYAFTRSGRYDESFAIAERVVLADPLATAYRGVYRLWLSLKGRINEAHEQADLLLALKPAFGYAAHSHTSLTGEGKIAESLSWAFRGLAEDASDYDYSAEERVSGFIWVGEYDEARRVNDELAWVVDVVEGRFDEAIQATQKRMQRYPEKAPVISSAANVLYEAGRIAEALPLFERLRDFVPEGRPIEPGYYLDIWHWHSTMRLALARRIEGDEEGAQAAVQIVRQDLAAFSRVPGRKTKDEYLFEAMIAAFEHNPDDVIAALKSAIQLGLRDPRLFDDLIFEDLWHEPRFVALQQELDALLAVEHDKVLQLICFNNPVPDYWQPLPETCEGVEEQSKL